MFHSSARSRVPAILAVVTLSLFQPAREAAAEVVLLDHFTGSSGSVPAGWTDIGFDANPASTIVESGTLVTINDTRGNGGPQFMQSSAFAATEPLSLTVDLASMSGSGPVSMAMLGGLSGKGLMVRFDGTSKNFTLALTNNGGSIGTFALPGGTHLPSYSSGTMSYTLVADEDSVRLTSVLDGFDSGDLAFASVVSAGVDSLDDLGSSLGLLLGTEASTGNPGDLATVAYDRVELTGTTAVPEPSRALLALMGLVSVAVRRRRIP
ncbi:MAG: hypothetical protein ACO1TE_01285 [Prosthecobacter sp.]